jgi:hypothetical protein
MLSACADIPTIEIEGLENIGLSHPRYTGGLDSEADGTVTNVIHQVEMRNVRNLEASNAAIAAHIGALSERLGRVEKEQDNNALQMQMPRARCNSIEREQDADHAPGGKCEGDPDMYQSDYAEFIATTQTNLDCVGVHTWSLCSATRRHWDPLRACCVLVPSVLLLVFQCCVLLSMGLMSFHPMCVHNEDCRVGMWCAPSKIAGSFYTRAPGMCDDCMWATGLSEQQFGSLPLRYNEDAYAAMTSETLASAVSHCNALDTQPDHCDFIVNFRNQLTLGPLVVLIFVTSLVVMSFVMDMDKHTKAYDVYRHRLANVAGGRSVFCTITASLIFSMRRFILPGVAAYSYATLVLAGPATSGRSLPLSVILCGLVVGFVYNIDSLLGMTVLSEKAQALVREAFADMEANSEEKPDALMRHQLPHFLNRFLATCLGTLILLEVLATESLLDVPLFRLDWDGMPAKWVSNPSPKSCTNVVTMLGTATILTVVFFTFAWSFVHYVSKSSLKWATDLDAMISPMFALLTAPVLSYIILHMGYVPVP